MRDPILSLLKAIDGERSGVAIVWCPDIGTRAWLVDRVESLVTESARPIRTASVEQAISEHNRLVLLIPTDERSTVLDMDGQRDRLLDEEAPRTYPVVLFLTRDGDGQRALAEEAPSLASWVRGNDTDPEELAEIDVDEERAKFTNEHGKSPEAWLEAWRAGVISRTPRHFSAAFWAMLLEGS